MKVIQGYVEVSWRTLESETKFLILDASFQSNDQKKKGSCSFWMFVLDDFLCFGVIQEAPQFLQLFCDEVAILNLTPTEVGTVLKPHLNSSQSKQRPEVHLLSLFTTPALHL